MHTSALTENRLRAWCRGQSSPPCLSTVQWKKSKVRLPYLLRKSLLSFHNQARGNDLVLATRHAVPG